MNIISKDDLNILDMKTLKQICNKYNIDYYIYIIIDKNIKKTNNINHKEIIINDIIYYLKTNNIPKPTIYKQHIQNYTLINNITANDYVYYGQYKTTNKKILKLLKSLTNNLFYFGAISQKLIKYIWRKNKLITYHEFAKLWLNEYNKGDIKYEELAYNQFMKKFGNTEKWFELKYNTINKIKRLVL